MSDSMLGLANRYWYAAPAVLLGTAIVLSVFNGITTVTWILLGTAGAIVVVRTVIQVVRRLKVDTEGAQPPTEEDFQ